MNLISKTLPLENVILDADSTSKKRVFERVGYYLKTLIKSHVAKYSIACLRARS